jgi:ParB family chromosome partitioning protein
LEALLGPAVLQGTTDGAAREIPISAIRPNPYQPRREFSEAALAELAESLRTSGLLQPIVVRPADGHYEIIAGERRWRAAERLGWKKIAAVVRPVDDRTLLALALVENLQRDGLTPIEEAQGYARLISEFSLSAAGVAELIGRDRSTVANSLRLLKLPDPVQRLLHEGKLSTGHARALLQLGDPDSIATLAQAVVARGLSVREVEALARGTAGASGKKLRGRPRAPQLQRVEDTLRRRLQTDVYVVTRGKGGRISINFYSNDDLARLLELILGEPFSG